MPNHTYKSAAVPFVNHKGERSMKRVKVERYVAGKKPSYARDDEDEEYYTTDEEDIDEEEEQEEEEHLDGSNEEVSTPQRKKTDSLCATQQDDTNISVDEDDDDPRFRKLKQLESKYDPKHMLDVQTKSQPKDTKPKVVHDDDDEEEDEVRQRHAAARARVVNEPIGAQAILGELNDPVSGSSGSGIDHDNFRNVKREQTEDILKDLVITGIRRDRDYEDVPSKDKLKGMIESARQESIMTAQIVRKFEEDNKKEQEIVARGKMDIGIADINSVNTDDEDDETAYEAWKVREIHRILRDRSERALETKNSRTVYT